MCTNNFYCDNFYLKKFLYFCFNQNIKNLLLGLSTDLKTLLYNPHLRNLLKEIDTAPNAWKAIRAAMHEPLFLEFADECLKIVEPNDESIEKWNLFYTMDIILIQVKN